MASKNVSTVRKIMPKHREVFRFRSPTHGTFVSLLAGVSNDTQNPHSDFRETTLAEANALLLTTAETWEVEIPDTVKDPDTRRRLGDGASTKADGRYFVATRSRTEGGRLGQWKFTMPPHDFACAILYKLSMLAKPVTAQEAIALACIAEKWDIYRQPFWDREFVWSPISNGHLAPYM
ncbi:MAG: hypothetical protein KDB07_12640, partial [Planctomycetes bacterium]|nr:hypothetical protein [Planctomycetota bacterium]